MQGELATMGYAGVLVRYAARRGARFTMSFGKNPHVVKAQAAEQKAQGARDEAARTLAWREAARLWDRAAEREVSDARKQEYLDRALAARAAADGDSDNTDAADAARDDVTEPTVPAESAGKAPGRWLN